MVSVARADLQDLWARGVAEEDGQAELARLGDSIRVHVEGLVTHELAGEQLTHRLSDAAEAAHEDVVGRLGLLR